MYAYNRLFNELSASIDFANKQFINTYDYFICRVKSYVTSNTQTIQPELLNLGHKNYLYLYNT